jgi:hypothetical protein
MIKLMYCKERGYFTLDGGLAEINGNPPFLKI